MMSPWFCIMFPLTFNLKTNFFEKLCFSRLQKYLDVFSPSSFFLLFFWDTYKYRLYTILQNSTDSVQCFTKWYKQLCNVTV